MKNIASLCNYTFTPTIFRYQVHCCAFLNKKTFMFATGEVDEWAAFLKKVGAGA